MSTRNRILDAALALFNEQGTGAVSTNHIAAAIDISPGNLYYHFRNKQDIIRALFEQLFAKWDETFQLPPDRPPGLADFEGLIASNYQLIWDYRFAYREMAALLHNDPDLQAHYQEVRQRGYAGFEELIEAFASAGVLSRPETTQELMTLTELCWILSEQWPVNLELRGRAFDAAGIQEGIALMQYIFRPYLTSERDGLNNDRYRPASTWKIP
jgi:AcrR family transcriptional regulator